MQVLIIGCGDIGRRIATRHLAHGDSVTGLVRQEETAKMLDAAGIHPLLADLDDHKIPLPALQADTVYVLTPPLLTGRDDPRCVAMLGRLANTPPGHLVYISSTAVYGNSQGATVDETTPPAPVSDRGHRRLAAEHAIFEFARTHQCSATILRVAAIYGPGRLPLKRLVQELPVLDPSESGPGNRIHADDLADLCVTAACTPNGQRIYNVSDNNPLSQADYLDLLADLAQLPRPPRMTLREAEQTLSDKQLEFLRERRHVDATHILQELNAVLRYADLADGLRASLAEEQQNSLQ